jgi:hypothetical protein
MMSTEPIVEFTELEHLDFLVACDYGDQFQCGPAVAGWEMRLACNCGHKGVRLACDDCKDKWLTADSAAECPACSEITAPARHLFWHVAEL